jgi:tRNA A-37 threonylcarbamoyl transferase component Bud32
MKLHQAEFTDRIQNFNSDVYFIIYIYILDHAPFNEECLNIYKMDIERANRKRMSMDCVSTDFSNQSMSPLKSTGIVSPTRKSRIALKTIVQKYKIFEDSDEEGLQNLQGDKFDIQFPHIKSQSMSNIDLRSYGMGDSDDRKTTNDNFVENLSSSISLSGVYESHIYEFNYRSSGLKKKKYWIVLVNNDIFFFKDCEKTKIKKIIHLSDTFVNEETKKYEYLGRSYYYFSLTNYKKKENIFYTKTQEEAKNWVKSIKLTLNQRNIKETYTFCNLLGTGGFASVYLAEKTNKDKVAIKIFNKKDSDENSIELVKSEIEILRCCRHQNILTYIDFFEDRDNIYLVSELMESGDLTNILHNESLMEENDIKRIMLQIGSGLKYLHEYGIIHRDLKPQNILVKKIGNNYVYKIADFGLSKVMGFNETANDCLGTIYFSPPELIRKKKYNNKVDVWSLGIILFFLIYGTIPFADEVDTKTIARRICFEEIVFPKHRNVSNECNDILVKCLSKNSEERVSIFDFLNHKWFNNLII